MFNRAAIYPCPAACSRAQRAPWRIQANRREALTGVAFDWQSRAAGLPWGCATCGMEQERGGTRVGLPRSLRMDAQCSRWHGFDLAARHAPASQPSASPQVSGGGPRSAGRRAAVLPPTDNRHSRPASAPTARKRPTTTTLTRRKRKSRSRWALSARRPRRAGSEAVRRANRASTSVAAGAVSGCMLTAQAAGSSDNARPP